VSVWIINRQNIHTQSSKSFVIKKSIAEGPILSCVLDHLNINIGDFVIIGASRNNLPVKDLLGYWVCLHP
jgi:hypothetical protein